MTVGVPLWHLLLLGGFTLLVLGGFTAFAPTDGPAKLGVVLFMALLSLVQVAYLGVSTGREARRFRSVLADLG